MIPKGLLVAIIVGMSSALALGVYLDKTYNDSTIKFVDGPSISITSDKSDYKLGESIKLEIINTGNVDVVFAGESSFRVRALDGTEFFSMPSNQGLLKPKEKFTITWDQQKNDNSHVLEGRYVIESFGFDRDTRVHDSITVNIFK